MRSALCGFLCGLPLWFWVFLGGTGRLGAFSQTPTYQHITFGLFGFTALVYVVVLPFHCLPRIWNGHQDQRGKLLKTGRPGTGVLRSLGDRGRDVIRWRGRRNRYVLMDIDVMDAGAMYPVQRHLALVPLRLLPSLREGMEFPVRISPEDRQRVEIHWDPLMKSDSLPVTLEGSGT